MRRRNFSAFFKLKVYGEAFLRQAVCHDYVAPEYEGGRRAKAKKQMQEIQDLKLRGYTKALTIHRSRIKAAQPTDHLKVL